MNNNHEYIERNIPQGRGMIKWLPMATMPKQYQKINRMLDEQDMVYPPIHDNDTLMSLEEKLKNSINQTVILRLWRNGRERKIQCKIEFIDDNTRLILVRKDDEYLQVEFKHIYDVI